MKSLDLALQEFVRQVRLDERRIAAREILEAMEKSGRVSQPGMWLAASILDPTIRENF